METIKESIENYNNLGHGVTTAKQETAGEYINITIYEPWKPGPGHVVKSFKLDETAQAQEYIYKKAAENAEYVKRYSIYTTN